MKWLFVMCSFCNVAAAAAYFTSQNFALSLSLSLSLSPLLRILNVSSSSSHAIQLFESSGGGRQSLSFSETWQDLRANCLIAQQQQQQQCVCASRGKEIAKTWRLMWRKRGNCAGQMASTLLLLLLFFQKLNFIPHLALCTPCSKEANFQKWGPKSKAEIYFCVSSRSAWRERECLDLLMPNVLCLCFGIALFPGFFPLGWVEAIFVAESAWNKNRHQLIHLSPLSLSPLSPSLSLLLSLSTHSLQTLATATPRPIKLSPSSNNCCC